MYVISSPRLMKILKLIPSSCSKLRDFFTTVDKKRPIPSSPLGQSSCTPSRPLINQFPAIMKSTNQNREILRQILTAHDFSTRPFEFLGHIVAKGYNRRNDPICSGNMQPNFTCIGVMYFQIAVIYQSPSQGLLYIFLDLKY